MNKTQRELEEETKKWMEKLDEKLDDSDAEHEQMENVRAYREDTEHFLEKDDYIRAWESIVYAWGILETLERMREIEK